NGHLCDPLAPFGLQIEARENPAYLFVEGVRHRRLTVCFTAVAVPFPVHRPAEIGAVRLKRAATSATGDPSLKHAGWTPGMPRSSCNATPGLNLVEQKRRD